MGGSASARAGGEAAVFTGFQFEVRFSCRRFLLAWRGSRSLLSFDVLTLPPACNRLGNTNFGSEVIGGSGRMKYGKSGYREMNTTDWRAVLFSHLHSRVHCRNHRQQTSLRLKFFSTHAQGSNCEFDLFPHIRVVLF